MTIDLKFRKKVGIVSGGAYGIVIPKAIADLLDKDTEYEFEIKEVQST